MTYILCALASQLNIYVMKMSGKLQQQHQGPTFCVLELFRHRRVRHCEHGRSLSPAVKIISIEALTQCVWLGFANFL